MKSEQTKKKKIVDNNVYDVVARYIQQELQELKFQGDLEKVVEVQQSIKHLAVIFVTRLEIFSDQFIVSIFQSFIDNVNSLSLANLC